MMDNKVFSKKRLAATEKYGFSPTLLPAIPSELPSPLPRRYRILAWITALVCSLGFYVIPVLILASPAIAFFTSCSIQTVIGLVILNVILIKYPHKEWRGFVRFFQIWYNIFNLRHNISPKTREIFENSNEEGDHLFIVGIHPHGILPLHSILWAAFVEQYLPPLSNGVGAGSDAIFSKPCLRQILSWSGVRSARREAILGYIQEEEKNVFIFPGGISEILLSRKIQTRAEIDADASAGVGSSSKQQTQVIKARRKGLMRLALQTGTPILPLYVFGGTNFFENLAPTDGVCGSEDKNSNSTVETSFSFRKSLGKFLQNISRRWKTGALIYWGQYCTPMPYAAVVSFVLGDPIVPVPGTLGEELNGPGCKKKMCRRIPEPSDEQIEELMDRYVDAHERLFEQYKDQVGFEHVILKAI